MESYRKDILLVLLKGFLAMSCAFLFIRLYNIFVLGKYSFGISAPVGLTLFGFFCLAYFLAKKNYFILSSNLILIFLTLPTLLTVYRWGLGVPMTLLSSALIVVTSAVLIGNRSSLFYLFAIIGFNFWLAYLQQHGIYVPNYGWRASIPDFGDVIGYSVILGMIYGISCIYNRELKKYVLNLKNSEDMLRKERDLLDIRVAERTKQLKLVEQEKIRQLEKFSQFGRLSSGIFHELANPLTALSLNLESLQCADAKDLNKIKENLGQALEANKRMQGFIKSASKQLKEQKCIVKINLKEEIEGVLKIYEYHFRKIGVEIEEDIDQGIFLYANPPRFSQVLSNLISNALDALSETSNENRKIVIIAKQDQGKISISIKDNGIGMSKDIIGQIFSPFFTTKTLDKGTGIGLSIVKDLVEGEFKGKISVKSKPDAGSEFNIVMPTKKSANKKSEERNPTQVT